MLLVHNLFIFLYSFVNIELLLNVVQRYLAAHPDVKVLDPVENVMRLSDRHQQYQFVKECDVVDESRFSRLYVQLVMVPASVTAKLCDGSLV